MSERGLRHFESLEKIPPTQETMGKFVEAIDSSPISRPSRSVSFIGKSPKWVEAKADSEFHEGKKRVSLFLEQKPVDGIFDRVFDIISVTQTTGENKLTFGTHVLGAYGRWKEEPLMELTDEERAIGSGLFSEQDLREIIALVNASEDVDIVGIDGTTRRQQQEERRNAQVAKAERKQREETMKPYLRHVKREVRRLLSYAEEDGFGKAQHDYEGNQYKGVYALDDGREVHLSVTYGVSGYHSILTRIGKPEEEQREYRWNNLNKASLFTAVAESDPIFKPVTEEDKETLLATLRQIKRADGRTT